MTLKEVESSLESAIQKYRDLYGGQPKYIKVKPERLEQIKKLRGYDGRSKKYKGIKVEVKE